VEDERRGGPGARGAPGERDGPDGRDRREDAAASDGLGPDEREALARELRDRAEALRREVEAAGDAEEQLRGDCDLDAADAGARKASGEQLRSRSAEALVRLDGTVAALERLRDGTYGVCTDCSRPLGRERLLAVPTAEQCVACRRRREAA
jgi:DnaK suppressor protein